MIYIHIWEGHLNNKFNNYNNNTTTMRYNYFEPFSHVVLSWLTEQLALIVDTHGRLNLLDEMS